MTKYLKVMNKNKSHASDFEYKIDEVNISDIWNPSADNPKDFGGFNFSSESKMLRWLIRGDTLYDVIIPKDAEVVEVENKNTPHGVFRTNKIIVTNPRKVTEEIVMDLYLKSDLPLNTYFQCLTFLSFKNYKKVCMKIIKDKVTKDNVDRALNTFETFFDLKENEKNKLFKEVEKSLNTIKGKK